MAKKRKATSSVRVGSAKGKGREAYKPRGGGPTSRSGSSDAYGRAWAMGEMGVEPAAISATDYGGGVAGSFGEGASNEEKNLRAEFNRLREAYKRGEGGDPGEDFYAWSQALHRENLSEWMNTSKGGTSTAKNPAAWVPPNMGTITQPTTPAVTPAPPKAPAPVAPIPSAVPSVPPIPTPATGLPPTPKLVPGVNPSPAPVGEVPKPSIPAPATAPTQVQPTYPAFLDENGLISILAVPKRG